MTNGYDLCGDTRGGKIKKEQDDAIDKIIQNIRNEIYHSWEDLIEDLEKLK